MFTRVQTVLNIACVYRLEVIDNTTHPAGIRRSFNVGSILGQRSIEPTESELLVSRFGREVVNVEHWTTPAYLCFE